VTTGAFLATSCDTPVGLGSKVNTEFPTISVPEDSSPGMFLIGSDNIIFLDVEQEFGIDTVYMTIEFTDTNGINRTETIPAYWDPIEKKYAVSIDTKYFRLSDGTIVTIRDGTIKATVTAIDVSGKKTTTTDMLYYVKNTPP